MDERWIYFVLVVGSMIFAYRAIVSKRILVSALFLAGISAMTAIVLYMLGAFQVAAIELSVGAGLVTVLLVFAISVVGDDALDLPSIIAKPLAFVIVGLAAVLLGFLAFPITSRHTTVNAVPLSSILWEQRVLDVWIQMALIFSGTMGMLGVLAEGKSRQRSGLHTLTEVEGQVPKSELYRQIPLGATDSQPSVAASGTRTRDAVWVKDGQKKSASHEEKA